MNQMNKPVFIDEASYKSNELFAMNTANDQTKRFQLAMAYVPWQPFGNIYTPELGLTRGTIFSDLDFPLLREEVTPRG